MHVTGRAFSSRILSCDKQLLGIKMSHARESLIDNYSRPWRLFPNIEKCRVIVCILVWKLPKFGTTVRDGKAVGNRASRRNTHTFVDTPTV